MAKTTRTESEGQRLIGGLGYELVDAPCQAYCFCMSWGDRLFQAIAFLLTGGVLALAGGDLESKWPAYLLGAVAGGGLFIIGRLVYPLIFDLRVRDFLRCRFIFYILGVSALLFVITSESYRLIFSEVNAKSLTLSVGVLAIVGISLYVRYGYSFLLPLVAAVCGALCVFSSCAIPIGICAWAMLHMPRVVLNPGICGEYYDNEDYLSFLRPVFGRLMVVRGTHLVCGGSFILGVLVALGSTVGLSFKQACLSIIAVYSSAFPSVGGVLDLLPQYLVAVVPLVFALYFVRKTTTTQEDGPLPAISRFVYDGLFFFSLAWHVGVISKTLELQDMSGDTALLLPDLLTAVTFLVSSSVLASEIARRKPIVVLDDDNDSSQPPEKSYFDRSIIHPNLALAFSVGILILIVGTALFLKMPRIVFG